MVEYGFSEVGLHRIVGRLEARNIASARVLEKLGMRERDHGMPIQPFSDG